MKKYETLTNLNINQSFIYEDRLATVKHTFFRVPQRFIAAGADC